MQKRLGWCCVSVLLAVAGCDNPPAATDAGPIADTGTDTGAPPVDAGVDSGAGNGCELTGYPALDLETVHRFSDLPTAMARAPGRDEIFVVLRGGQIRIMALDGTVTAAPFLNVASLIGTPAPSSSDEYGLLGLAFHPDYATNGLFYIAYTAVAGAAFEDRLAIGTRSTASPDEADATVTDILVTADPRSNHNGGILQFGPDGFLYYGLGDGGRQGDPDLNGQDVNEALGKIHRISVGPGIATYEIPPGNPFADGSAGLATIWAYGFRNPWRFSFDRLTGDFYIADVGQDEWEEIDFVPAGTGAGENFGWSACEGTHDFRGDGACDALGAAHHGPIYEYSHSGSDFATGGSASITGGFVYRGSAIPGLNGAYLFGDTTTATIGALRQCGAETREVTAFSSSTSISGICAPTTFGDDAAGEIYIGCYGSNEIVRIIPG